MAHCELFVNLQVSQVRSNRDEIRPLVPSDRRDRVALGPKVTEPGHVAVLGRPEVHGGAEAYAQSVTTRPVHQVQVEVILKVGGVQHLWVKLFFGGRVLLTACSSK